MPPKMAPLGISTVVAPPELALAAVIADRSREVESLEAAARRVMADGSVAGRLAAVSRRLRAHDAVGSASSLIAAV